MTLPGVGRKTANLVLGDAFGGPGITVDTHVARPARRLGWTEHTDPARLSVMSLRCCPAASGLQRLIG